VGESYLTIYGHFNILLFLGINAIISGLNNTVKEGPLPLNITFYTVVILPEDDQNSRPKHAAYVNNKRISEHLRCISQIIIVRC